MGFPSYRINRADFEIITTDEEDMTQYLVTIEIENLGSGRMPVPIVLSTSKGPIEEKVWIGDQETVIWTVRSKHLPKKVSVDPRGWILMEGRFDEKTKTWGTYPSRTVEPIDAGAP